MGMGFVLVLCGRISRPGVGGASRVGGGGGGMLPPGEDYEAGEGGCVMEAEDGMGWVGKGEYI